MLIDFWYSLKKSTFEQKMLLCFFLVNCANFFLCSFCGIEEYKMLFRACSSAILLIMFIYPQKTSNFELVSLMILVALMFTQGSSTLNIIFLLFAGIVFGRFTNLQFLKIANLCNICLLVFLALFFLWRRDLIDITVVGERVRHTFGNSNANVPSVIMLGIVSVLFLEMKTLQWRMLLFCTLLFSILYFYTDSRTCFGAYIFMLIFYYFSTFVNKRIVIFISQLLVVLFAFSPLIWPILEKIPAVDDALSLRPGIFSNYMYLQTYRTFLWGGSTVEEVDNFYLVFLYSVGIFFYVLFFSYLLHRIAQLVRGGKYIQNVFLLAMLLIGNFESILLRPEYICVILFWYILLMQKMEPLAIIEADFQNKYDRT